MRQRPDTTALIIPALNEAETIGDLLDIVPHDIFGIVVVADNGSTDSTARIARDRGAIVVHASRRGYGHACLAAIDRLPPAVSTLVFIQADMSENPQEADLLLQPIRNGRADLVVGSRVLRATPGALLPHQRFGNWLATSLIRLLYGHAYTDLGPFRAIRRDAFEKLAMRECTFGWTVEMQVRALQEGLRVTEVPVSYQKRAAGENKVSGNAAASIRAGILIISTIFRLWLRHAASR